MKGNSGSAGRAVLRETDATCCVQASVNVSVGVAVANSCGTDVRSAIASSQDIPTRCLEFKGRIRTDIRRRRFGCA